MEKIVKTRLPELFALLAQTRDLYLPLEESGQVDFGRWTENSKVALDAPKTVKSPKDLFFPSCEPLYRCEKEGKSLRIIPESSSAKPFVVFGVRSCDVKGMEVLDHVFLEDPVDTFYAARREQGILVAMACGQPEETCFCAAFGIDAAAPRADVSVWMIGEDLYWKAQTERGEALTKEISAVFAAAEEAPVLQEQDRIKEILERIPYHGLSLDGFGGDALDRLFLSPKWQELYKACLGCGTCTFLCPTCQCYDIRDYDSGNGIERFRCWDSCMYSDFTQMAHGNPRTTQLERFRQRFMHKLVYFPDNHDGMYSCVGCGRCVSKCPSSLNIVKVIKTLGQKGGNVE